MPADRFPRLASLSSGSHPMRSAGARWIFASLIAALACCLLVGGTSAAAKPHPKQPAKPVYWGAWVGDQITGTDAPWDMGPVAYFEQLVGKGLSLVEFSSAWQVCGKTCTPYKFPVEAMDNVRGYGAIPVYSWGAESSPRSSENQPEFQLADIIGGAYDSYIAQFAAEARDWGHPFFLRPNWEMNGGWFPWSELANGNSPGEYVAAWRHIHDIFGAVGATNVTWVWCPYADTEKRLKKTSLKALYPGNGYVDWTCLDAYNWGRNAINPKPWRSFDELFSPAYKIVTKQVAPKKPLMLGEFATSPNGGHKALWIRQLFERLPRQYPRVRALIYFNTVDRGIDWPLETSPPAASAFAKGIRKGIYANNRFGELASSPILPLR
jgi:mannan endo-1,4-beta-mannosidase